MLQTLLKPWQRRRCVTQYFLSVLLDVGFNGSHKVLNVASAFYSRHVSTKVAILSKTIAHGLKGQNASHISCCRYLSVSLFLRMCMCVVEFFDD